jgi:hypothetical protein
VKDIKDTKDIEDIKAQIRAAFDAVPRHEKRATTESQNRVGQALDRFIGTWSAEQEAEVLAAVEVFEQIDESLWQ